MGVINITPNSFSDGNVHLNTEKFLAKWNEHLSWARIIDIGAESTAPFNDPISAEEEISRFEKYFFPYLSELKFPEWVSIDTYKVEVFDAVYNVFKHHNIRTKLIFNDVSGCIDDELKDYLKTDKDFDYVFCHNLAPTRDQTSFHMNFKCEGSVLASVESSFYEITNENFKRKIYLDPCFGFSKTREQNLELLKNLHQVTNKFENSIVFGISRKSFLRSPPDLNPKNEDAQKYLAAVEALSLNHFLGASNSSEVVVRTHGPWAINACHHFDTSIVQDFTSL